MGLDNVVKSTGAFQTSFDGAGCTRTYVLSNSQVHIAEETTGIILNQALPNAYPCTENIVVKYEFEIHKKLDKNTVAYYLERLKLR
jgi:hypothetical protein